MASSTALSYHSSQGIPSHHYPTHHPVAAANTYPDSQDPSMKRPRKESWQAPYPQSPAAAAAAHQPANAISNGASHTANRAGTAMPVSSKMIYAHGHQASTHHTSADLEPSGKLQPSSTVSFSSVTSEPPISPITRPITAGVSSTSAYLPPRPVSVPLTGEQHPTHRTLPTEAAASDTTTTTSQYHHHHHQAPAIGNNIVYTAQNPFPAQSTGTQPLAPPSQPAIPSHQIASQQPAQFHHHTAGPPQSGFGDGPRRMSGNGLVLTDPNMNPNMPVPVKEELSPIVDVNMSMVGMYGSMNGQQQNGMVPRRKAVRAAQACDACRNRKAKCDEGRPNCGFCQQNNQPCVYREVPIPKQDRTMLAIQGGIDRVEASVDRVEANVESVGKSTAETLAEIKQMLSMAIGSGRLADHGLSSISGEISRRSIRSPQMFRAQTHITTPLQTVRSLQGQENDLVMPDLKDTDQGLTIPLEHTTPAHKLLEWPSIRSLLSQPPAGDYVLDGELNRGSLHVYGRGEGDEGYEDDDEEDSQYTARTFFRNVQVPLDQMLEQYIVGGGIGLGAEGGLKLSHRIVDVLLRSYNDNFYILHPFLDMDNIRLLANDLSERFGNQEPEYEEEGTDEDADAEVYYNMSQTSTQAISPHNSFGPPGSFHHSQRIPEESSFAAPPSQAFRSQSFATSNIDSNARLTKRKRESVSHPPARLPPQAPALTHTLPYGEPVMAKRELPRTLNTALILLVLALGAVAGHRAPVPGPLEPSDKLQSQPPLSSNDPSAYADGQPPLVPTELLKNIDVIPGLAYLSKALEILSLFNGRNSLEYVQAGLLAGLYWSQLGRVLDSWRWISNACMACQVIMRKIPSDQDAEMDPRAGVRRQSYLRVFWSCLQLESDVLAELGLPPSGITRLEGDTSYPTNLAENDQDALMWMYFHFQCSLRKILNTVHSDLYDPKKSNYRDKGTLGLAKNHDNWLEGWRDSLPQPLRWNDNDAPAKDINAARLRAKYYGAKYIIHRPFIHIFLHHTSNNPRASESPALSTSELNQASPASGAPATPVATRDRRHSPNLDNNYAGMETVMLRNCETCIDAAIRSTSAFHAFDPDNNRPVLTNIFGTAHAQFGNMLVLQAAYHSRKLQDYIKPDQILHLLQKTTKFLSTLAPISATLSYDLGILKDSARRFYKPQTA